MTLGRPACPARRAGSSPYPERRARRRRRPTRGCTRRATIPTGRRAPTWPGATRPSGLGGNHRIGNELNRGHGQPLVRRLPATAAPASGATPRRLPLVRLDEAAGLVRRAAALFHDGERLRFVLDGDGCRMELEIVGRGRALVRQRADLHRTRRARPAPSSPTTSTCSAGSAARWSSTARRPRSTRRPGGTTRGVCAAGTASSPAGASGLARRATIPAVPLRIHGRRQRQLLPPRLAGPRRRAAAGRRAPRCWCTSTTTPCAVPRPRCATAWRTARPRRSASTPSAA